MEPLELVENTKACNMSMPSGIVATNHMVPRMVAGASVTDAAALTASPGGFPITGIAAVMTSPEWLAAGSEAEAEEHISDPGAAANTENKEDMVQAGAQEMRGEHPKNSEERAAGDVQAPTFVQPYLAAEDTAMMVTMEVIAWGIYELLKRMD